MKFGPSLPRPGDRRVIITVEGSEKCVRTLKRSKLKQVHVVMETNRRNEFGGLIAIRCSGCRGISMLGPGSRTIHRPYTVHERYTDIAHKLYSVHRQCTSDTRRIDGRYGDGERFNYE